MPKVAIDKTAPDFTLEDFTGKSITLSDFRKKKNIVLVFNRGLQ